MNGPTLQLTPNLFDTIYGSVRGAARYYLDQTTMVAMNAALALFLGIEA
jgi:hypothetical protein